MSAAPQEMLAVVISATRTTAVIKLPAWSDEIVFHAKLNGQFWPPLTTAQDGYLPRPAINIHYRVEVDTSGPLPKVLSWRSCTAAGDGQALRQETLAAPFDLPAPPDRLPILDQAGLSRLLAEHLGTLPKVQREKVAYLMRRAYGQGIGDRA